MRNHNSISVKTVALVLAGQFLAAQIAAADREAPLLANERHLLSDTESSLLGVPRENRVGLDSELLLDTTYDTAAENLLLDTNIMFEENLQEALEHSPQINECAQNATVFITKNLPMAPANSLALVRAAPADQKNDWRRLRIDWICAPERMNCGAGGDATTLNEMLANGTTSTAESYDRDAKWKAAYTAHCVVGGSGTTAADLTWAGGADLPAQKKNCEAYGKLLKMLYTQFPYFGGSSDFKHKTVNLEYWLYQLSTLTKDPGRQGPAASESAKNILDYVTPAGSLVPKNNPRNLGLGITDGPNDKMSFAKLPWRIRTELFFQVQDYSKIGGDPRWLAIKQLIAPGGDGKLDTVDKLAVYWDSLDDVMRKKLFGDILLLPWSFAHMKAAKEPWAAESNVVGVRGNVLLTPEAAKVLYLQDFTSAPRSKLATATVNWGAGVDNTVQHWADEFATLHKAWYDATRAAYMPIIGGMSGHTLGYLNAYVAALAAANQRSKTGAALFAHTTGTDNVAVPGNLCTLERMRAVMLAGLIGNKRHHSYTEVMTASVGFTYQWTNDGNVTETLAYAHKDNYNDLFASGDPVIKAAAERALKLTSQQFSLQAPSESVFRVVEQWGGSKRYAKKNDLDKPPAHNPVNLQSKLYDYVRSHESNEDTAGKITAVKRAVAEFLTDGGAY